MGDDGHIDVYMTPPVLIVSVYKPTVTIDNVTIELKEASDGR